ncbi:MAG: cyclic-di-AMP receptor [Chloroflexi bacterium]|nr:cyclic-di-AMP receptor [Chloroflexota bacterium]
MKLITAIVHDEDASRVLKALTDHQISATRIASTGGFLRRGSTLLLIGVEGRRLEEAIDLIRASSGRRRPLDAKLLSQVPTATGAAGRVEEGGAIIMVTDVERYLRV